MCDIEHAEVVESPEDLVCVYFDEERVDIFFFDYLVEIIGVVIHNDVEVFAISLVSQKTIFHN